MFGFRLSLNIKRMRKVVSVVVVISNRTNEFVGAIRGHEAEYVDEDKNKFGQ